MNFRNHSTEIIVISVIILAFVVLGLLGWAMYTSYTEFMTECQQHHAQYECRVLYRSGQ